MSPSEEATRLYALVDEADDLLVDEGKPGHAFALYAQVIAGGAGSSDMDVREAVAESLYGKAQIQHKSGLFDSAAESLTRLLTDFDREFFREIEREPLRGKALLERSLVYEAMGRRADALADWEAYVEGYYPNESAHEQALGQMNRARVLKTAAVYGEALRHFEEAAAVPGAGRPIVALASVYCAMSLDGLGRDNDARAAYRDVLDRFGDCDEVAALARRGLQELGA